jgi:hypothetical protein
MLFLLWECLELVSAWPCLLLQLLQCVLMPQDEDVIRVLTLLCVACRAWTTASFWAHRPTCWAV